MKNFVAPMKYIYESHKDGKSYILSREAQNLYNEMDSYVNFINEKYNSDSGDYNICFLMLFSL